MEMYFFVMNDNNEFKCIDIVRVFDVLCLFFVFLEDVFEDVVKFVKSFFLGGENVLCDLIFKILVWFSNNSLL